MINKIYYIRYNGLISKKINNEFIVIDSSNKNFFTLNETGELIYKFLHKKRLFGEILSRIAEMYTISQKSSKEELAGFLNYGIKFGLFKNIG